MQAEIKKLIEESITTKQKALDLAPKIEEAAKIMITALKKGNKIMACGNGGSAADAQHFVAELVCIYDKYRNYKRERMPLAAIALSTDTSVLTAVGNDYGFDNIFERQVSALGKKGDLLLAISTSGNSPNVIKAIERAQSIGVEVLGLTGDCGKMKDMGIFNITAPSKIVARVQECHIMILHILCDIIEKEFFVKNE